jgi:serpin B
MDRATDGGADLPALVRGTNEFAVDLHRSLPSGENTAASPLGLALALAMVYAGARGQTERQMAETLGYPRDAAVHAAFGEIQRRLDDAGKHTGRPDDAEPFALALANAVWGQADYPFAPAYRETLATHYGDALREVDYRSDPEGARATINEWVADETRGHIENLLPPGAVDTLTRLVLVNAVYFQADWKHPFESNETSPGSFTALDGTEHAVPMMSQRREWAYAERDGTKAVELPYVGDEVSMLVVLPPAGAFESVADSLDAKTLATLADATEPRPGVRVALPRFEFEWGQDLAGTLAALGMPDAFDADAADFGKITVANEQVAEAREDIALDGVYHEAYVAVDEAGTEAAAATGATMGTVSIPPTAAEFVADRPFLFAIRHRPTGAILFLGRVVDPRGWR